MATETIADILREMRECANAADPWIWWDERIAGLVRNTKAEQLKYADRIEKAHEREDAAWRNAVLDFCDAFTMVYEPPFNDCPAMLAGAFLELCDKLGIEQVKTGDGNGK